MAVKKSTAPKSGTKTAKSAVKKAAPQKAAPQKADAKAIPKAGAKKAPGVKLTEPQKKLLESVAATKDEGIMGTKGNAKMLAALLEKKLVKKGKKENDQFRYHITKLGSKHSPAPGSSTTSSEPSSAPST